MPRRSASKETTDGTRREQFASRVRAARNARALSTRALAAEAGVSQSLISQIERGECEPSLATLRAIAAALHVRPDELLGQHGSGEIEITRRGDQEVAFSDSPDNVTGRRLISHPDAFLEAYQLTVSPGGGENWFQHPGEEIVIVHSGTLEVHFAERDSVTLAPGDTLYYPGDLSHLWRNSSEKPVVVTHVVASGSHNSLVE